MTLRTLLLMALVAATTLPAAAQDSDRGGACDPNTTNCTDGSGNSGVNIDP